jgi:hypothetical protein
MSFFLCHDCYTWVQPLRERCPECHRMMDLSAADPTAEALRATVGELRRSLGEVRVRRPLLPEYGLLYETDRGLFFAPHETGHVRRDVEQIPHSHSLLWMLGSLVWAPLGMMLPVFRLRAQALQAVRVPVLRPRYLDDSTDLSALLMADPGAFFLPRATVRQVRRRRRRWIVTRVSAKPQVDEPLENASSLHTGLQDYADRTDW